MRRRLKSRGDIVAAVKRFLRFSAVKSERGKYVFLRYTSFSFVRRRARRLSLRTRLFRADRISAARRRVGIPTVSTRMSLSPKRECGNHVDDADPVQSRSNSIVSTPELVFRKRTYDGRVFYYRPDRFGSGKKLIRTPYVHVNRGIRLCKSHGEKDTVSLTRITRVRACTRLSRNTMPKTKTPVPHRTT